jgi:PEP-CTERM motif
MGRFIVAAVLGLMVVASGPADAGVIFTYSFSTDFCSNIGDNTPCTLTGSFAVDSAHFSASGNTDISSFITDLLFSWILPDQGDTLIFDAASGFHPEGVTVTPAGNLTRGPGENFFVGDDTFKVAKLQAGTEDMGGSLALMDWDQETVVLAAGGPWATQPPILAGDPVPEPATWVLISAGALMLALYAQRRRVRLPKIAYTV